MTHSRGDDRGQEPPYPWVHSGDDPDQFVTRLRKRKLREAGLEDEDEDDESEDESSDPLDWGGDPEQNAAYPGATNVTVATVSDKDAPLRHASDPLDWTGDPEADVPVRHNQPSIPGGGAVNSGGPGKPAGVPAVPQVEHTPDMPLIGVQYHGHDWMPTQGQSAYPMTREAKMRLAAVAAGHAILSDKVQVAHGHSAPTEDGQDQSVPYRTADSVMMYASPEGRVVSTTDPRQRISSLRADPIKHLSWDETDHIHPGIASMIRRPQNDHDRMRSFLGATIHDAGNDRLHAHVHIHPDPAFRELLKAAVLGDESAKQMLHDFLEERGHRIFQGEEGRRRSEAFKATPAGPELAGHLAEEMPVEGDHP